MYTERNEVRMRVAIVTGASSGMGREFVLQIGALYKNLDEIWVIARRKGNLERVAEQSRLPLRIFDGDLLKKPVYKAFCEALCEDTPDIRMLVNAAGFGRSGSVEEINMQRRLIQTDMVGLNCQALTRMTLLCLPYMHPGSRIVNLASAAAFCPQPYFAVYAATKSYVLSFSRSLREELKTRGIIVTAVCPGPVDTPFFDVSGKPQNFLKELTMAQPGPVVHQALKDSRKRKELSIYGLPMKLTYAGTKLLPHKLLLRIQNL